MPYQPAVLGNARLNNFRLNYLTAEQAADRPLHIRIILGGIDITKPDAPTRVIFKSMTIRDVLFEAPNTCALTLYGAAPTVGQPIEVWINSNAPVLLFGGELQTVERTYKGRPTTVCHPVTAIDDTARANRRRPLRSVCQRLGDGDRADADRQVCAGVLVGRRRGRAPGRVDHVRRLGSRDEGVSDGAREADRRVLVFRE